MYIFEEFNGNVNHDFLNESIKQLMKIKGENMILLWPEETEDISGKFIKKIGLIEVNKLSMAY